MVNKIIVDTEAELISKLSTLIETFSNSSIEDKNAFNIGFSGGSVVKFLCTGLPTIKTDFSKWKIFFCDERLVPIDSPDSTYGVYKRDLLDKIPIKEEQFVKIKQGVSAVDAANDYTEKLKEIFPTEALPRFDLLLLGMGPDGHTCSLFPDHPLLRETNVWVAPITDSPKPPSERITFTFPVINNAKCCVFSVAGESKSVIIKRILLDQDDLPAARVKLENGELYWILDKDAAKCL